MSLDDDKDSWEHDERGSEFDWSVYGDHDQATTRLEGKDIIALFIASLQTIFLPLVILAVLLLIIGLLAGIFL